MILQNHPKINRHIFIDKNADIITDHFLRWSINRNIEFIPEKERTKEIMFAQELYWAGYVHMMKKWIASGMQETFEHLGEYAYMCLPSCLKKYYQKN